MIHIVRTPATQQQMNEMLQMLGAYVKLAVNPTKNPGGWRGHARRLRGGFARRWESATRRVGADWNPTTQQVTFESLINIRPRQNNPALDILDPVIQRQVAHITQELLGGV